MANARVPDEFIFCRDANTHQVESREICHPSTMQPQFPPCCPEGLTRTQKRRLQHEIRENLVKGENSGQYGDQQQPDPKGKGPSADVNMVFMLPMEFLAPSSDDEELDFSDQIAQLALDPMMAIFEKPADDQDISRWWGCYQYYTLCSLSETWERRSRFDQDQHDAKRF